MSRKACIFRMKSLIVSVSSPLNTLFAWAFHPIRAPQGRRASFAFGAALQNSLRCIAGGRRAPGCYPTIEGCLGRQPHPTSIASRDANSNRSKSGRVGRRRFPPGWRWAGDQMALYEVATSGSQHFKLVLGLHALGESTVDLGRALGFDNGRSGNLSCARSLMLWTKGLHRVSPG